MFEIEFFELLFLAEVCIPPQPIARYTFFYKLSSTFYHKMNDDQKNKMFKFITKNTKFDIGNKECLHFYCRFNPENQFSILTEFEGKKQIKSVYKYEDNYHVTQNQFINEKYIRSIDCL